MPAEIPSRPAVDRRTFIGEIVPARSPVVLRGAVRNWPLVQKGLESARAAAQEMAVYNGAGTDVDYLAGMPAIEGRYFYNESLSGENFQRQRAPFQRALALILEAGQVADPPALSIQGLPVARHLPDLELRHLLELAPKGVHPLLWIENANRVAAHFACADAVVCVAAGRYRYTLFPPAQVANLYIGPLHATPQGVPVSMVDAAAPDYARYPRYAQALEHAQVGELEPGDALYIPYMWWQSVEALAPFNVLARYGWEVAPRADGPPFTALMHALLSIGQLPPQLREIWRAHFDHFVFHAQGEPSGHVPPEARGMLGPLNDAQRERFMAKLIQVMISERPDAVKADVGKPLQRH